MVNIVRDTEMRGPKYRKQASGSKVKMGFIKECEEV